MADAYYPPVGFHFSVELEGQSADMDCSFQEISGLSRNVVMEDYAEGGENRFTHKLPKGTNYENLVLKRGVVKGSRLVDWFIKAMEELEFEPINLSVNLLNEEHKKLCTWSLVHSLPVKWSVSGLNAESSGLLIETMEINYHYFTYKLH
jgi:phage tail-like protein